MCEPCGKPYAWICPGGSRGVHTATRTDDGDPYEGLSTGGRLTTIADSGRVAPHLEEL